MPKNVVPPAKNPFTIDVFLEDMCLALNNGARKIITFTPLAVDEMPRKGTEWLCNFIKPSGYYTYHQIQH
jgi:hypothetical protein